MTYSTTAIAGELHWYISIPVNTGLSFLKNNSKRKWSLCIPRRIFILLETLKLSGSCKSKLLSWGGQARREGDSKVSWGSTLTTKGSVPQHPCKSTAGLVIVIRSAKGAVTSRYISRNKADPRPNQKVKPVSWVRFSTVRGQAGQTYSIAQAGTKSKGLSFIVSPRQMDAAPMVASHRSFSQQCSPRIGGGVYQSWPKSRSAKPLGQGEGRHIVSVHSGSCTNFGTKQLPLYS